MTKDRKSKLLPNRQVERDPDSLTNKGSLGNGEYIGIADRNSGLHLKIGIIIRWCSPLCLLQVRNANCLRL